MPKKGLNNIDELPYKQSMTKDENHTKGYWYGKNTGVYRKIGNYFPWTHVERTLKKFKGKNVNKAFTHYCSVVDTCQQYMFWDEINEAERYGYKQNNSYRWGYWYVDKQNRIQYKKPKKPNNEYVIYSHDFKMGTVKVKHIDETKRWWKKDYTYWTEEREIIQGERFIFKKKNDAYHKCYAEQLSKGRKVEREAAIEAENKAYSFLTMKKEYALKNKEIDIIKRDSHGFDEDSFTSNDGRLNN